MQEKHSDDPMDEQMIDNFSNVKFCCIKCGSRIHIPEQYFSSNQTVDRVARYIIASIECNNCKNQSFVTINLV